MITRVITLWRIDVTSMTTSVSTMRFLLEILPILKAIKSTFIWSYDKQNLTRVVISYEIYETSLPLCKQIVQKTVSSIDVSVISKSYTMVCPHVRGDNPRALATGLSTVQVYKPWLLLCCCFTSTVNI